jgi:phage terminase large subunit-like protein
MHEWKSRRIEDDLRQGQGTRLEPVALFGSSAGLKSNPVGVDLFEESAQIRDGLIDDPTTLVVIFAAPEESVWDDEEVWRRCNPSLGLSPTIQYLRTEARKAKGSPVKEARFRCYHLGQFIDDHALWLNSAKWRSCARPESGWRDMLAHNAGRRTIGAFDMSATQDITALAWSFPPDDDFDWWRLGMRFWIPEDTLEARKKESKLPWDEWVASGAIETTPGSAVDQNYMLRAIKQGVNDFAVERIGYDSWNTTKLIGDLQEDGLDAELLVIVRQGIHSMGAGTKEFERIVYSGRLDHGGHPVLSWMARNVKVRFDENLNYMPAKRGSKEKIDGIVAAVMGQAVWLESQGPVLTDPWADPDYKLET